MTIATTLRRVRLALPVLVTALLCATGFGATAAAPSGPGLSIEAVSNRADLVSGGDVLVRVTPLAGIDLERAKLAVNGTPVPDFPNDRWNDQYLIKKSTGSGLVVSPLMPAPDGNGALALVEGLKDGKNILTVTFGGKTARLEVTNHPSSGPLFSGPQIQPWPCLAGATGTGCDRGSSYSWYYMPRGATAFKTYNPVSPPTDVATTTTSGGLTVPYVVRIETFNQDRSGVQIATLFDQDRGWTAWDTQPQWNKGVLVLQGAGCGTGYGEKPAGSPLNDRALGQGFVVVAVALLNNTINCNPIVQAEAALMAKEHVAETYGLFDLVFGMGSSGGAISQIADQNAYPGLYDGLILNHLFADSDASRMASYDCKAVYDYWSKAGTLPYSDAQKVAVIGMISGCNSHVQTTRYEVYNASTGTDCNIPAADKFNAATNPKGVRCTLQDYEVNEVGRRPDGYANERMDTVGVQYGLKAVKAGTITPAQFVEMNAAIGGHDINFARTEGRTVADRAGLKALYATGLENTATNLADTPIIETRVLATDFHQVFNAYIVRARVDRAQGGHHENYALWRSMAQSDPSFGQAFDVMVSWIKAIKADTRDVPRAQKVVDDRPAMAHDRCTLGDGKDQPQTACPRPLELARVLAGAPDTDDVGKCQLKPLNRADYGPGVTFTAEQWSSLQHTFPTGVCDYSKPMVDFGRTTPWLSYSGNGQARPLGPPPTSHAG